MYRSAIDCFGTKNGIGESGGVSQMVMRESRRRPKRSGRMMARMLRTKAVLKAAAVQSQTAAERAFRAGRP